MAFQIDFWPDVEQHLGMLTAAQRAAALDGIQEQLRHEPMIETRTRKAMRANPLAPWELRLGAIQVYYDVSPAPERVVTIRAIGLKRNNEVWIRGRGFVL